MTDVPALGISYEFRISDRRSIVFQTHVSNDVDAATLNELLDSIQVAGNRQQAMLELVDTERQLAAHRQQLNAMKRDLVEKEAEFNERARQDGRRVHKLSNQEVAHLDNMKKSIENASMAIATNEGLLSALKNIAGQEPPGAANGNAEA